MQDRRRNTKIMMMTHKSKLTSVLGKEQSTFLMKKCAKLISLSSKSIKSSKTTTAEVVMTMESLENCNRITIKIANQQPCGNHISSERRTAERAKIIKLTQLANN